MKKIAILMLFALSLARVLGCDGRTTTYTTTTTTAISTGTTQTVWDEKAVYQLLIDAENLSGMSNLTAGIVNENGSLGLPTSYRGVEITYSSRHPDIISNDGIVTLPDTCWIDSRNQQGEDTAEFDHLNDNWPIVVDVQMSFMGQIRTAKLMFVVAPAEGFTCDKYLG